MDPLSDQLEVVFDAYDVFAQQAELCASKLVYAADDVDVIITPLLLLRKQGTPHVLDSVDMDWLYNQCGNTDAAATDAVQLGYRVLAFQLLELKKMRAADLADRIRR